MKKFIFVLIVFTSTLYAGKGSLYSRYGFGEINPYISARGVGMGNNGIALFSETDINLFNPAAAANINRTLFSGAYQHRTYFTTDGSLTSSLLLGNIQAAALAFPIYKPSKSVLVVSLQPLSASGYNLTTNSTVGTNTITQTFDGHGGLSKAQVSLSYEFFDDVILSGGINYIFGAYYKDQSMNFSDPTYYGGSFNETTSMSGSGLTIGGMVRGIDKKLNFSDGKNFNLGFVLSTSATLETENELLRNFSSNTDTVLTSNLTSNIPLSVAVGISYSKSNVVYAGDFHFQNWGSVKFSGKTPKELQNSLRAGFGAEFLPSAEFTDEFWERVSYRIGGFFQQTNLKINGQSINEIFGSAGLSFPVSAESRLHLGMEYGIRGTTSSSLYKDTIIRFTAAFTISELMFIPPKVD